MADFETPVRQTDTQGLSGDALSHHVSKRQNIYREKRGKRERYKNARYDSLMNLK